MNANPVLLQKKYAKMVLFYAEKYGIDISEALGQFYKSKLYELLSQGVSDLHCMSEAYLAEELHNEITNKKIGG